MERIRRQMMSADSSAMTITTFAGSGRDAESVPSRPLSAGRPTAMDMESCSSSIVFPTPPAPATMPTVPHGRPGSTSSIGGGRLSSRNLTFTRCPNGLSSRTSDI